MEYVAAFVRFNPDQYGSISLDSRATLLTTAPGQTGQIVAGNLFFSYVVIFSINDVNIGWMSSTPQI